MRQNVLQKSREYGGRELFEIEKTCLEIVYRKRQCSYQTRKFWFVMTCEQHFYWPWLTGTIKPLWEYITERETFFPYRQKLTLQHVFDTNWIWTICSNSQQSGVSDSNRLPSKDLVTHFSYHATESDRSLQCHINKLTEIPSVYWVDLVSTKLLKPSNLRTM